MTMFFEKTTSRHYQDKIELFNVSVV